MQYHIVVAISPTNATLFESDYRDVFTPRSTEYITVTLDEHFDQVGHPDYGYKNKRQAQRLAARLNRHEKELAESS